MLVIKKQFDLPSFLIKQGNVFGLEFAVVGQERELKAKDIALLYKERWQVELFFRWIKLHLRVKSFGEILRMPLESRYIQQLLHIVSWPLSSMTANLIGVHSTSSVC